MRIMIDKKITPQGYFFDFILRRHRTFCWW